MPEKRPAAALDTTLQKEAATHLSRTTNTLILDYLLWLSAKTVIQDAQRYRSRQYEFGTRGRRLVGLVDGLILSFEHAQQPKLPSISLTYRLHLSALAILFVYRDAPPLTYGAGHALDRRHHIRQNRTHQFLKARKLNSCLDGITSPRQRANFSVEKFVCPSNVREEAAELFGLDPEVVCTQREGSSKPPMLLDALEGFFVITADNLQYTQREPSARWVDMACDFMIFASLEAYLVEGATGLDVFNACFAWGEQSEQKVGAEAAHTSKSRTKNAPFLAMLEPTRTERLDSLVTALSLDEEPETSTILMQRMLDLARTKNFPDFRVQVLSFLEAVLDYMKPPELCAYGLAASEQSGEPALLSGSILTAPGEILISHDREVEDTQREIRSGTGPLTEQPITSAYYESKPSKAEQAAAISRAKKARLYA